MTQILALLAQMNEIGFLKVLAISLLKSGASSTKRFVLQAMAARIMVLEILRENFRSICLKFISTL